ncbi:MAG: hypothetical protein Q4P07_07835 [Ornithinimicrobium sp.]|uniref:hypothetical protein n=1 Tax=Ornithinimicrobium sp. TaxID=1977084 RepID=UPI0026DEEB9D|nr:hypothetical protein [Ornithinimicrobium sp.]MDO5740044.1 hypothetical protein [Ornithinimicrobium sp.]
MDHANDGAAPLPPSADELHQAFEDQRALLSRPSLPEVVEIRVGRALDSCRELLDLSADLPAREVAARSLAWLAESVGAFQRLPERFAVAHTAPGQLSPLLTLVDGLDLLGLTLDRAYDAIARADEPALARQLDVLTQRLATRSKATELVDEAIAPVDLDVNLNRDDDRGEAAGEDLQVGGDGIPRLPVPEQPNPYGARSST